MGRSSEWNGSGSGGGGGGGGSGDVVGPASATDGDVALFDGASGKLIKDSGVLGSKLLTTDDQQTVSNKVIDGGTAGATRKLLVPKNTKAALDALVQEEALLTYATDEDRLYVSDGIGQKKVGTVDGPSSVTDGNVVLFDGASGKLLKDAGVLGSKLLTTDGQQTVSNKVIDGGTAGATRKLLVPKNTKAALDALVQEEALLTYATDEDRLYFSDGTIQTRIGTVDGPSSSTDNRLVRMDGATGKVIQETGITVDDSNNLSGLNNLTVAGNLEVQGTSTTLNTQDLQVEDKEIEVNYGGTDASAAGAGLSALGTGNASLAKINYDSALQSRWKAGPAGSLSEVLTAAATQTVTAKDIDGGTASNTSRLTLPKNTLAGLTALARKAATIVFATDTGRPYYDDGTSLQSLNPMTALGDILVAGAAGILARLAGDTSNTRKFLRTQSSGGVAAAPAWDTLQASDLPTEISPTSGTATVAFACGSGSATISASAKTITWVKFGKIVFIAGRLDVSSVSSPGGYLRVTGLPYSAAVDCAVPISTVVGRSFDSTTQNLYGKVLSGTSYITIEDFQDGDAADGGSRLQFGSPSFIVGGFYITT